MILYTQVYAKSILENLQLEYKKRTSSGGRGEFALIQLQFIAHVVRL